MGLMSAAEVLQSTQPGKNRFYELAVQDTHHDTRESLIVTFDIPAELKDVFRFVQGQYLTLRTAIDGKEVRRSYSICAAVQDRRPRIGIKRALGGLFSNWAHEHLKPGARIEVMPPAGRFNVPLSPEDEKQYLAIAAGSGITPVFSIIKTTLLSEPKSRFTLFYGNRASASVMFREELADLKDRYMDRFCVVHVLSREKQEIDLLNGRITRERCSQLLDRWEPHAKFDAAFICGPHELMLEVSNALRSRGLQEAQIKMELFGNTIPNTRPVASIKDADCQVTMVMDGIEHAFSLNKASETILEAGLRHGLEMRYSCRGGVCSTCRAHLREGEVEMDANFSLEDYEIDRGFILTCQSYPVTDRIFVDFDRET
jgi:ring-1,2-phenylacetyl-CoA epoxidase subunit PaaE